ncbi:hypothetical protein B5K08_32400 [Rhizobium leguminosarum bv. trifolii]|uniref:Uncharacterized protein n=1 Tax=Rhizobium leguminosarum bv. trifolii TaxID=386 RepID=A0A3E1AYZ5_RHILT|nr:hypothetical protein B5K10_32400 [Rhizobium leguminosarum bv. trifolii]RFB82898.1 hypothetical protein B5K08_32400 [Rhizobium leguminosarum bv. trifolii]
MLLGFWREWLMTCFNRRSELFTPSPKDSFLEPGTKARKISIDIYNLFRCQSKYKIKHFLLCGDFFR